MFYSKLVNKILTSERVVHPVTGEVYGGKDFDNPDKLEELQVVPVLYASDEVPEYPLELPSTEGLSEDGNSYVITNHYRSKTEEEIATELENERIATETALANAKITLLDQIYKAYEEAETSNLTPAGAIKLAEECANGNLKALANRQWFVDLYAERDTKLTLAESGDLSVNPTPSTLVKPYTFREMLS